MLPDTARVITDYGVSTAAPVGVTKTITDQAGKKRKGFSDALGNMVRVVEDPTGQNLNTDYVFDVLGNLRKTTQGVQNRYFMLDSLGRLLYAKQPEQTPQSFNRYSYVLNSPYKFTDPLGLLSVDTIACGMCGNESLYVDGSAFRGRDTSFDWTKPFSPPAPRPLTAT